MPQFTFETVWPDPSPRIREEVVGFWHSEGVLSRGKAIERSAQLLVVCRDKDNAVAGVSTAVSAYVERLGMRCYFFRALVAQTHRAHGLRSSRLIHDLLRKSYDVLNARFQDGSDRECLGLYLEIENESVQRHRDDLVWSEDGANVVFVGYLPDGRHARAWYFDGARLRNSLR